MCQVFVKANWFNAQGDFRLEPFPPMGNDMYSIPIRNDGSLHCIFLMDNNHCAVYEHRPMVCRLQGTVDRLPCPNNKKGRI